MNSRSDDGKLRKFLRQEYLRAHKRRPDVMEKNRLYHQRPEVKAHRAEYMKEYFSRPDAMKKLLIRKRKYNRRRRALEKKAKKG